MRLAIIVSMITLQARNIKCPPELFSGKFYNGLEYGQSVPKSNEHGLVRMGKTWYNTGEDRAKGGDMMDFQEKCPEIAGTVEEGKYGPICSKQHF